MTTTRRSRRALRRIGIGALLCFAPGAFALTLHGKLEGGQINPPASTTGNGSATAVFIDSTTLRLSYDYADLSATATAAHLHAATIGANGPVVVALPPPAGTGGSVSGLDITLTPAQVAAVRDGLWYVDVHSAAFPGGEIRGQLLDDRRLNATLTGAQMVPPTGSTVTGVASIVVNRATREARLAIRHGTFPSTPTAMHIHTAATGSNGAVAIGLAATANGNPDIALPVLTPVQLSNLLSGQWYIDVHTSNFPGGEIRGQFDTTFLDSLE